MIFYTSPQPHHCYNRSSTTAGSGIGRVVPGGTFNCRSGSYYCLCEFYPAIGDTIRLFEEAGTRTRRTVLRKKTGRRRYSRARESNARKIWHSDNYFGVDRTCVRALVICRVRFWRVRLYRTGPRHPARFYEGPDYAACRQSAISSDETLGNRITARIHVGWSMTSNTMAAARERAVAIGSSHNLAVKTFRCFS